MNSEQRLYYTPPPDAVFDEVKEAAIELWSTYDDTHGYATSKIDRIKDIENVSDNFMYIVAMFDVPNQIKLGSLITPASQRCIYERMVEGGAYPITIKPNE